MEELFPLAAGLTLGVAFAADLRWLRSWPLRAALIVLAGGAATVGSGEFRTSWGLALRPCDTSNSISARVPTATRHTQTESHWA